MSRWRTTKSIRQALGLGTRGVVAFVGAGGKTSTIAKLLEQQPDCLATTTTHLALLGFGTGLTLASRSAADLDHLWREASRGVPVALAGWGQHRLETPDRTWLYSFLETRRRQSLVLIEADGARGRLLKLPAIDEPVFPPAKLDRCVIIVNLASLGQSIHTAAHHPERFRHAKLGARMVGLEHLAAMLAAYIDRVILPCDLTLLFLGATGFPDQRVTELQAQARRLVRARNQSDHGELRVAVADDVTSTYRTCRLLIRQRRKSLPGLTGVLLAAGRGRRYRAEDPKVTSKLLLPLGRRTLFERTLSNWLTAGLDRLVVIVGYEARKLAALARRQAKGKPCRVEVYENPRHARGLSTSVRLAARHVEPGQAMLFGHADMPSIPPRKLRQIAEIGLTMRHMIVVPRHPGGVSNPAFFPADLRNELRRVSGEQGGKQVYRRHADRLFLLPEKNAELYHDVDTPQQYEELLQGRN